MALMYIIFYLLIKIFNNVSAHGYMEYPVQRSSLWRINKLAPINYDDNGLNCGGKLLYNQFQCGLCGDDIKNKKPRFNEIGGKYYINKIVKTYNKTIIIKIKLTANHKGYFNFYLCNLDKYYIESRKCFKKINRHKYQILPEINNYIFKISTKEKCKHCVLQWVWVTGNNGDSKKKEIFVNCADINII